MRLGGADADTGGESWVGRVGHREPWDGSRGIASRTLPWMVAPAGLRLAMGPIGATLPIAAAPGRTLLRAPATLHLRRDAGLVDLAGRGRGAAGGPLRAWRERALRTPRAPCLRRATRPETPAAA